MSKLIFGISNHKLENLSVQKAVDLLEVENNFNDYFSSLSINEKQANFEFENYGYIRLNSIGPKFGEIQLYKNVVVFSGFHNGKYHAVIPLILSENWNTEINLDEAIYKNSRHELINLLESYTKILERLGGDKLIITSEKQFDIHYGNIKKTNESKELYKLFRSNSSPTLNLKDYIGDEKNKEDNLRSWVSIEQFTNSYSKNELSKLRPEYIIDYVNTKSKEHFKSRIPNELLCTTYQFGQTIILKGFKMLYENILDFWLSSQSWYSDGEDTFYEYKIFDDLTAYDAWKEDANRVGQCNVLNEEQKSDIVSKIENYLDTTKIMEMMEMNSAWNNRKILITDENNYYLHYFWTGE